MANKHHKRRKRRQARAAQKHGVKAKPSHKALFGRTGQSMKRKNPSKSKFEFNVEIEFEVPKSMSIYEVRKNNGQ